MKTWFKITLTFIIFINSIALNSCKDNHEKSATEKTTRVKIIDEIKTDGATGSTLLQMIDSSDSTYSKPENKANLDKQKFDIDIYHDSIQQVVLKESQINQLFVFGKWNKNEDTETHLKYLGEIEGPTGTYKIMTSIWYWGQSKRATSRILLFNLKNVRIGNYYLETTAQVPDKIDQNHIVFTHDGEDDCDQNLIQHLAFDNGIPNSFFLECKNNMGDILTINWER